MSEGKKITVTVIRGTMSLATFTVAVIVSNITYGNLEAQAFRGNTPILFSNHLNEIDGSNFLFGNKLFERLSGELKRIRTEKKPFGKAVDTTMATLLPLRSEVAKR